MTFRIFFVFILRQVKITINSYSYFCNMSKITFRYKNNFIFKKTIKNLI